MIVVFYGKRNSGKTTLCREFYGWVKQNLPLRCHYLDADKLRFVYGLKGFSEQTERALIQKAMEISRYEESLNDVVLLVFLLHIKTKGKFLRKTGVFYGFL